MNRFEGGVSKESIADWIEEIGLANIGKVSSQLIERDLDPVSS